MSLVISRSSTSTTSRTFKRYCKRCLQTQTSRIEQHDLVIVGGGPAGLALTAALGETLYSFSSRYRLSES